MLQPGPSRHAAAAAATTHACAILVHMYMQAAAPRRTPLRVQNLRVNNVEIPNGKRIEISLQYIYGIGQTTAQTILRETVRSRAAIAAVVAALWRPSVWWQVACSYSLQRPASTDCTACSTQPSRQRDDGSDSRLWACQQGTAYCSQEQLACVRVRASCRRLCRGRLGYYHGV